MRAAQLYLGFVITLLGIFLLAATSGVLILTWLDLLGGALILSGLLFWIPGIIWRRAAPGLTALFIPGALAFAIGAALMYTARTEAGFGAWAYLWTLVPIALGGAFWAMHWLGGRASGLRIAGNIVGGVGVLLFAIFTMAFAAEPGARLLGPGLIILLGIGFTVGAWLPRKPNTPHAER